jgi:alkanesulfonate monooxygenase SsuD/methylene tetrahydromethanopterin reductase-like flavin-dependent oxidoreductase (luciferase family)
MQVGVALPQMAPGFTRATMLDWCRAIDEGPFSSISAGERITFFNPEMITLLAGAAMLTERVEIIANVCVSPWHKPALLAKQFSTIDVLSGGRLTVALGVGGREEDYAAMETSFAHRHQRVDDDAAELRRLWSAGEIAGGIVGPRPSNIAGPPLLCSSMGPKSMARAAQWAQGVSGFAIGAQADEAGRLFLLADQAWAEAGRLDRPRKICGLFCVAGSISGPGTLRRFATEYLSFMGIEIAGILADMQPVHDADRLRDALTAFEKTGCDEVILVPATTDVECIEASPREGPFIVRKHCAPRPGAVRSVSGR